MTLQPGNRLGNYEIVEKIGAGGMGAVYKCYQTALGRYVAIKVLPPQTAGDPAFGDRLDYAHARGVVHRDIKPQNILLTRDGMPVLTDFGLAKIVGPGSGMTQAGSLMGTAEYIAPECASGAEVAGPAADQYALGLIAYQMLVGRHPFPADNPLSALMAHVHKPVPLPSSLGVSLPPGVEAALLRSLAKRPEERFARSGDFVRALAGSMFAGTAPIFATTPPTGAPGAAPSRPPTVPPADANAPSPFLSPSALVRPLDRAPSTPPATAPAVREPTVVTPAAPTIIAGAAAATTAPLPLKRTPPWWRRRRMLVLPAVILLGFGVLSLPRQDARAGATGAPTRTPARTVAGGGTTTAPVATPTPTRTPEPTPTFNYGHTPQTATTITPGVYNGDLTTGNELDYFRFDERAGTQIIVEYKGSTLSGGAIALLFSTTPTALVVQIVEDTDAGNGAKINYTTTQAGVYYLRVRSTRGDTGNYSFGLVTTNR